MSVDASGYGSMSDDDYKKFYEFLSQERLIEIIIKDKREIRRLNKIINEKK